MSLKRKLSRLSGVGPGGMSPPDASHATAEPTAPAPFPVEPLAVSEVAQATPPAGDATDTQRAREEKLRRNLAELGQRRRPVVTEAPTTALPTQQVVSPYGPLWMREELLAEDHHHGLAPVRRVLELDAAWVADLALDPSLAGLALEDLLLFDTETTGLAGGTGTLPFVVGLGWFESGRLRVCQLLLERPGQEGPILRFLEERLARASCLVTYNGKTFDWPLIRSRFVMNRMSPPKPRPHLDLLHCARRVFRHRPGGAKLVQIEREVLGFHRVGDIPGEEIPELYFRFLRSGRKELLEPVLTHNGHDLVLLAALLGMLGQQYGVGHAEDPRDALGFASVAARAGQPDRALAFAEGSALRAPDGALQSQALALAAEVWRRAGRFDAAIDALQRALRTAPRSDRPQLHLMLSKLLEHRAGELAQALVHAQHTLPIEGVEGQQRRIERLERRLRGAPVESNQLEVEVEVAAGVPKRRPA